MSIARIGEFQTHAGLEDEMLEFLNSIMPLIISSAGCELIFPQKSGQKEKRTYT